MRVINKAPSGQWLTREQAANRAKVDKRTIDRWLSMSLLTRYRIGKRGVRIRREELDRVLEPREDGP